MQGRPSLDAVSGNPEAENLLLAMLQMQAKQRPSMEAVMAHPFWWRHERRLAFLLQVSDRVELEDREVTSALSFRITRFASTLVVPGSLMVTFAKGWHSAGYPFTLPWPTSRPGKLAGSFDSTRHV